MGVTQQKYGVATVREIVNFLMLRGNLGRPGTDVCPVRGHSNVQGDRTMGHLGEDAAVVPRCAGARVRLHSPVEARRWMRLTPFGPCVMDGQKLFVGFAQAISCGRLPDSELTEQAMPELST